MAGQEYERGRKEGEGTKLNHLQNLQKEPPKQRPFPQTTTDLRTIIRDTDNQTSNSITKLGILWLNFHFFTFNLTRDCFMFVSKSSVKGAPARRFLDFH